jgi:hypothetical protein
MFTIGILTAFNYTKSVQRLTMWGRSTSERNRKVKPGTVPAMPIARGHGTFVGPGIGISYQGKRDQDSVRVIGVALPAGLRQHGGQNRRRARGMRRQ